MITMLSGPLYSVVQAIGWALLHLLWQGVLVAGILAATLALMQRQSASARYLASCGAMIALLVLLVATAFRAYDAPAPAPLVTSAINASGVTPVAVVRDAQPPQEDITW